MILVTHRLQGCGVQPVVLRVRSTWGPLMDPESPFNYFPPYISAALRGDEPQPLSPPTTAATAATHSTPGARSPC
jgi:hypothetical protein